MLFDPGGSYGQEKMRLQGVGCEEFQKYKMEALTPAQLSDFCGNAFLVSVSHCLLDSFFSDSVTGVVSLFLKNRKMWLNKIRQKLQVQCAGLCRNGDVRL